jgi:hypothetical protein
MLKYEASEIIYEFQFLFLDKIDRICFECNDCLSPYNLNNISKICYIGELGMYDCIYGSI